MDASELISLYSSLFYASLALCLLGLVCAALFFFLFDIPTVFSQLTGIGKERALQRMREKSKEVRGTGGLTTGGLTTGGLGSGELPSGVPGETAPLASAAPVETAILPTAAEAGAAAGATALLTPDGVYAAQAVPAYPGRFEIFEKIIQIHTDEMI